MALTAIELPLEEIAAICRAHHVAELALFGSALRDDFRPDSDLDFLVTFDSGAKTSLFDLVDLQQALGDLLGRKVDVITRPGLERSSNDVRKQEILGTAASLYVAR